MIRLKMKTTYAGPLGTCSAGGILDVATQAEADALIEAKVAELFEPLRVKAKIETASMEPPANASMPAPRGRRAAKGGDEA